MALALAATTITLTGTAQAERPDRDPASAATIARTQVATWTCQDQLQEPRTPVARSPWALGGSWHYRQWVLALWVQRRAACLERLHEQARQWNWQAWLPANWSAVARCETHHDWFHSNSRFVSAFGISRREYDNDAAYMGAPPWNDARPPSPWNQYQAALGHYKRFGDGWGCPGP